MPEPILWCDAAEKQRRIPAQKFNPETGEMENVYDPETGDPVWEKIPQRPHSGDNNSHQNPVPLNFRRWMHVLKNDGNIVRVNLNCASAERDLETPSARQIRQKGRFFGWIEVGKCPVTMVMTGDLRKGQLMSKECKDADRPCEMGTYGTQKWCPHFVAEEKARKERKTKTQISRDRKFQPEAEKLMESQREQSKEIASAVASAVAEAMRSASTNRSK